MNVGECYIAWSGDEDVLEASEHGGVITSLLKFALKSKMVDAVLFVDRRDGSRLGGVLSLVRDADSIRRPPGALHCVTPNIAKFVKNYLDGAFGFKLAVVVKPCDARAIVELAKREQVNRENLLMIGVNCSGTFSPQTFRVMLDRMGVKPEDVVAEEIEDGKLVLFLSNGKTVEEDLEKLEEEGLGRRENCRRCEVKIPRMADLAVGKWGVSDGKASFVEVCSEKGALLLEEASRAGFVRVEPAGESNISERARSEEYYLRLAEAWQKRDFGELREMKPAERLRYWLGEFERCVKCFACRDVCPICYCTDCRLEPERGIVKVGGLPPERMFSLLRIVHVADSCVNCGQCQDVCMAEIPIAKLCHMINKELSEMFNYVPGMSVDEPPPLAFVSDEEARMEDPLLFFTELRGQPAKRR
ncbi:MAG: Coenzyme F420 hydrogenase/dehydrogenase, beta subunit C-terminal domain [Candidatus Freyarchaeota archaeon]|nr:Coenzyme F420 hydrogenase/dehydrogenase, beta subunit C-terminal domain [Candidatus Freyrarchaeum guaymaensis]HDO81313.1 formate dehydrogenase [Candidatus Bathyarchaeota archaeon]